MGWCDTFVETLKNNDGAGRDAAATRCRAGAQPLHESACTGRGGALEA